MSETATPTLIRAIGDAAKPKDRRGPQGPQDQMGRLKFLVWEADACDVNLDEDRL